MKSEAFAIAQKVSLLKNGVGGGSFPRHLLERIAGIGSEVELDRPAEISRYKRLRAAAQRLLLRIADAVPKDAHNHSARLLGRFRDGAILFDGDTEYTAIVEHAIFNQYHEGANTIQRFVRGDYPVTDPDEQSWLQALAASYYSLFLVFKVDPGFGAWVADIISGKVLLLVDLNISLTPCDGLVLASRILPLGNYWATSGCGVFVQDDRTLPEVRRYLDRHFGETLDWNELDRIQIAEIETLILRYVLAGGSTRYTIASEPGDLSRFNEIIEERESLYGDSSRRKKIGRNESCPCGSGRKYKKCCGRGMC